MYQMEDIMEKEFWQALKEFMLDTCKKDNCNIMDYYATMKQNENDMQFIVNDCNNYDFSFQYEKPEEYTSGSITVYFQKPQHEEMMWVESFLNYVYKINLLLDERYWGYCQCEPGMKDYD